MFRSRGVVYDSLVCETKNKKTTEKRQKIDS